MSANSYMKSMVVMAIVMAEFTVVVYGDNFSIPPGVVATPPSRAEFHVTSPYTIRQKAIADLSCNISVYKDEAGTLPISNGGSYGNGSSFPPQWVKFKINNAGPQKAENVQFSINMVDVRTGSPLQYKFTIGNGESQNVKLKVDTLSHENNVVITGSVIVDGNTTIDKNTLNNTCRIRYHVSNVS